MRSLLTRTVKFGTIIACVAAAVSMTTSAPAAKAPKKLTITLTSKGIKTTPAAPRGGSYVVVVKNHTHQLRGIELTGKDLGGSPYARYSNVLPSGAYKTFRWYFPKREAVTVRDMLTYDRDPQGRISATFGSMRKAVRFK